MPTKLSQKQILIVAGAAVVVIGLLVLVYFNIRPKTTTPGQQTPLNVWGTDDARMFQSLSDAYSQYRSGAKVNYTHVDSQGYEDAVVRAIAAGNGPDVFEIGNRDLPKWRAVLAAMPTSTFAAQFDLVKLESYFPTVVEKDFVSGGGIYALPLSIDTLAMVYNKDIFDSMGIALPPKTWDEFQNDIPRLRTLNNQGQITRAAAAIGGSGASIANAADILSLLMLQNGAQMTDSSFSSATFAAQGANDPGTAAFNYYLQFANAASPYYTWNDAMGDAFDSFVNGKTAIIFAYEADLAAIKAKAPFLNIGIAPMPQPKDATIAVNYPKYQGLAVSRTGQVATAWDFVLYLTTYTEGENIYISATGKPPAQRYAISQQLGNPDLSVFASQALTARSWYEADDAQVSTILSNAILSVLSGATDSTNALHQAQTSVSQLMNQY